MATVFHKTPPPWLEAVKDLKPGGKRRIADGVMASFNGRAYQRWDFREKTSEVYEPQLTLAERLAISKLMLDATAAAVQSTNMPEGMKNPQDWPVEARVWLHKASFDNGAIRTLGAVWNAATARVVIPLRMLDGSEGWVARTFQPGEPKYLFPTGFKRGGGAVYHGASPLWSSASVVITEDYLSAWRVTEAVDLSSVSALGTSLDRDAISTIAQQFAAAYIWLDPDHYGQLGARKIARDLQQLGVRTYNVVSRVDPKLLTDEEIRAHLNPEVFN